MSAALARAIELAGLGLAAMALIMGAVYLLARRLRNAGIVDVAWSLNFTPLAVLYALSGDGDAGRRLALAFAVSAWSLRLAFHLAARVAREHPREDGRYAALRTQWGAAAERRMFAFFQLQGGLNVVLATPFALTVLDPRPFGAPLDLAALALLAASLAGEALADRQLRRFKADASQRGQVCRVGLWAWSRHPNYFFEWCAWCAFALLAWAAPAGPLGLVAPALMLFFLLRVTGIPATEEQALRSRGEAYRRYQREVSAFVPLPPRRPR